WTRRGLAGGTSKRLCVNSEREQSTLAWLSFRRDLLRLPVPRFQHSESHSVAREFDAYILHGACVLKRARRNFTRAAISASDICWPSGGMDRPSAPVGGLMPLLITCTTLSGTGAWIELWSASGTVAPL